jgi:uncharacterized protein (DUF1330 family)
MNEGYGPADHDAYESRVAPVARKHGMVREAVYTVNQFLAGTGPKDATSVGVWSLDAPSSLQALMSDPAYKANIPLRNRIHAMKQLSMFLVREAVDEGAPRPGHAVLVALLVLNEGHDAAEQADYEKTVAPIAGRHGLRLFKSYHVVKGMAGPGAGRVALINFYDLPTPDALGRISASAEYKTHIPHRNRVHDMTASSFYFVAPR